MLRGRASWQGGLGQEAAGAARRDPAATAAAQPQLIPLLPQVGGNGIKTCLAAGVEVAVGCEESECYEINAEFMERMRREAGVS